MAAGGGGQPQLPFPAPALPQRPQHRSPPHLQLQPPGPGRLPAEVTVVEPLGSDTLVNFQFDGQRHVARVAPEHTPRAGDSVHFGIAPERAHLFDAGSGAALR